LIKVAAVRVVSVLDVVLVASCELLVWVRGGRTGSMGMMGEKSDSEPAEPAVAGILVSVAFVFAVKLVVAERDASAIANERGVGWASISICTSTGVGLSTALVAEGAIKFTSAWFSSANAFAVISGVTVASVDEILTTEVSIAPVDALLPLSALKDPVAVSVISADAAAAGTGTGSSADAGASSGISADAGTNTAAAMLARLAILHSLPQTGTIISLHLKFEGLEHSLQKPVLSGACAGGEGGMTKIVVLPLISDKLGAGASTSRGSGPGSRETTASTLVV
jgi:hypothetical protein